MADEFEALPPTLQNVLDQKSLKWIFCGESGLLGPRDCPATVATRGNNKSNQCTD